MQQLHVRLHRLVGLRVSMLPKKVYTRVYPSTPTCPRDSAMDGSHREEETLVARGDFRR